MKGDLTERLFQLEVGDNVIIRGPKGNFTLDFDYVPSAILVGGGIGITPLISMFRTAAMHSTNPWVTLFHSAKKVKELLFNDELGKMAYHVSNLNYFAYITQQSNWHGNKRRITVDEVFDHSQSRNFFNCRFYLCGPGTMNTDFKEALIDKGVEPEKIFIESYYES